MHDGENLRPWGVWVLEMRYVFVRSWIGLA